ASVQALKSFCQNEFKGSISMPDIHEKNLDGRVAIVTGSGQNIGAAIARRLAEAGAAVVVNGHASKDKVERTVSEIRATGGRAHSIISAGAPHEVRCPPQ